MEKQNNMKENLEKDEEPPKKNQEKIKRNRKTKTSNMVKKITGHSECDVYVYNNG